MRKLFCFLLVLLFAIKEVNAKDDDSSIIRRAYIDTIGVIPTIEELEWYCVYNTDGYSLAIDWLIEHKKFKWNMPKEYSRLFLLSTEYRNMPKVKIEKDQVYRNLLYVTGSKMEITEENMKDAKLKMIQNAILCEDTDSGIVDYMCNTLMGRTTNLKEINQLMHIIRNYKGNEIEKWMKVLNEILEFEDSNSK